MLLGVALFTAVVARSVEWSLISGIWRLWAVIWAIIAVAELGQAAWVCRRFLGQGLPLHTLLALLPLALLGLDALSAAHVLRLKPEIEAIVYIVGGLLVIVLGLLLAARTWRQGGSVSPA
jgi:hypothetical protein